MARASTGITYEQVAATAEAISGDGQLPTIARVREALGTGSPNTIHKHLIAWRALRPKPIQTARGLPASLVNEFDKEIRRASDEARAEVMEELIQAQSEVKEAVSNNEVLETERDDLAEIVTALTTERDSLQAIASERGAELSKQAEVIAREQAAAESARIELAKAQLKIEAQAEKIAEQASTLGKMAAELEKVKSEKIAAEQSAAVLASKFENAQNRAADLERREQSAAVAANAANTATIAAVSDLARAEKAAAVAAGEASTLIANLKEQLAASRDAEKKAQNFANKVTGEIAELKGQMKPRN